MCEALPAERPQNAQLQAFSLLELSIVLAIIGTLLAGALVIGLGALDAKRFNMTVERMDAIHKALLNYSISFNRLPCPSSLTLTDGDASYGVEAANQGTCTGGTPAANFSATSGTAEGGVPTRTLQLPDDYMYDAWGRRLRYAIDPVKTEDESLPVDTCGSTSTKAITVKDAAASDRSTNAVYALVSHGANGHGGYTRNGVVFNAGSTNTDEQTNCHCNSSGATTTYAPTYVAKLPTESSASATDSFDDIATFREAWQLQSQNAGLGISPSIVPQILSSQAGPAMAQTVAGIVQCWGYDGGAINGGSYSYPPTSPVSCIAGYTFSALSVAFRHMCGITTAGALICKGINWSAQIGNGAVGSSWANVGPYTVMSGTTFNDVAVGDYNSCAITAVGLAYCWGDNAQGQIGDGTTVQRPSPALVSGGHNWRTISIGSQNGHDADDYNGNNAGTANACGVTTDGTGYCWGGPNGVGQAGDGTSGSARLTPTLVSGGHIWKVIVAGQGAHGYSTNCGITASDDGYCWGAGDYGQLGNGTLSTTSVPVLITGSHKWLSIQPTERYVCGVTTCGDAYCWGWNTTVPTLVPGGYKWSNIAASNGFVSGITTSGGLMYMSNYYTNNSGATASTATPLPALPGTTFR